MQYLALLLVFILFLLCVAAALASKKAGWALFWGCTVAILLVKLVEASLFLVRPWA